MTWFEENGKAPRKALEEQIDRLSTILGCPLELTHEVA